MQCYTILYTETGFFLTFIKRTTSYFFHDPDAPVDPEYPSLPGGKLFPDGKAIKNGPGLFAFPGGKFEDNEAPFQGCLREFTEECGSQIWFRYTSEKDPKLDELTSIVFNIAGSATVHEEYDILAARINSTDEYYALYLQVSDDALSQIEMIIMDTNLEENANAAAEVNDGNFGKYGAIFKEYPYCPLDNELSEANIWQVQVNIDQIKALNNKASKTEWYYDMIVYLDKVILGQNTY